MKKSRKLKKERLLDIFRDMYKIRYFEDEVYYMFLEGKLPGTVHQCQGQEAVAVGVCSALRKNDFITSTHRSHGHSLAKGMAVDKAMAELFAKKSGCCGAKGGSMHFADIENGIIPSIAVVGEGLIIGPGLALAYSMKNTDQVAVTFFGDGAVSTGAFHEGINISSLWELPIVFVCENNQYAASTSFDSMSPVENVVDRASAYNIPAFKVNGMDVLEVYEVANKAISKARSTGGPTLIECETFRYKGHSRSDPQQYKDKDEVEFWKERDPIDNYKKLLIKKEIVSEKEIEKIEKEVEELIKDAIKKAEQAEKPSVEEVSNYVY